MKPYLVRFITMYHGAQSRNLYGLKREIIRNLQNEFHAKADIAFSFELQEIPEETYWHDEAVRAVLYD